MPSGQKAGGQKGYGPWPLEGPLSEGHFVGHGRTLLPPERVQHPLDGPAPRTGRAAWPLKGPLSEGHLGVFQVVKLKPTNCTTCGALLLGEDAQPVRHQVSELPRTEPDVTEYQQHTLTCLACGTQNTAECHGP